MKKAKQKIAVIVKDISKSMAIAGGGSASHWGTYQPKEPKNIYKK